MKQGCQNRTDRSDREPHLHPVRVSCNTGLRMNRKTGQKPEKTRKNRRFKT
jgi:hypothetical protein